MKAEAACVLLVFATVISANLILYDVFHKHHFKPAKLWHADLTEFPYYCHIIPQKTSSDHYTDRNLGGVIIDKQWVVTLASATIGASQLRMLFGLVDLSKRPKLIMTSNTWLLHPNFNVNNKYWQSYDLCLVRLPQEISFNEFIKPTRLDSPTPIFMHPGLEFVTCSYEKTKHGLKRELKWTFVISTKPHDCDNISTTVDPLYAECTRLYPMSLEPRTKDYCEWDRGSPLINVADDGVTTLVGISPGPHEGQCDAETPKVFISMSAVYGWIKWTMAVYPTSEPPETLKTTKLLTSQSNIENNLTKTVTKLPTKEANLRNEESHLVSIKTDLLAAEDLEEEDVFSTVEPKIVYLNILTREQLDKLISLKKKTEGGLAIEPEYVYFWPPTEPEEVVSNSDLPTTDIDLRTTETDLRTTKTDLPTTEPDFPTTKTDLPTTETDLRANETDLPTTKPHISTTETLTKGAKKRTRKLRFTSTKRPTTEQYLPTLSSKVPTKITDAPKMTDTPTEASDLPPSETVTSEIPSSESITAINESNISNSEFGNEENSADEPFFVADDEEHPTQKEAHSHHHRVKREAPKPKRRAASKLAKPKALKRGFAKGHRKRPGVLRNATDGDIPDSKYVPDDADLEDIESKLGKQMTSIEGNHGFGKVGDYGGPGPGEFLPMGGKQGDYGGSGPGELTMGGGQVAYKQAQDDDRVESYTERSSYTLMIGDKPRKINLNVDVKLLMNDKDRRYSIGR